MRSLSQQQTAANRLELNDDGTAKRKYEQEEGDESRIVLRSTIGLVLANALILVKTVLFSAEPSYAAGSQSSEQQGGQQPSSGTEELPAEAEPEQGDGPADATDDLDAGNPVGSGTSFGLISTAPVDVEPELAPIHFHGSGHIASSNDNEQLYGARPGHGIGLSGDSIAATSSRHSSSHGGGGGHGGGSHGTGQHDDPNLPGSDPDDQDDDDDDDDTGHGPGSTNPDPPRQSNRLPIVLAPIVLSSLFANEARAITMADLLANASDPDGDTLTIHDLKASSGTVVANSGGGWTFTPDEGDTSEVTFTYKISDGKGSVAQTASLDLVPMPPSVVTTGTSGPDDMIGTPGDDILDGLAGNDLIYGREGNDVIYGGDGDDRLVGGDGDDVIFGGAGNDVIFGNAGNDVIDAGEGDDFADGGEGSDAIRGGSGNDILLGGTGADFVSGDDGNDIVRGEAGNDIVDGGAGEDVVEGGDGNDVARGGTGDDAILLGDGDDIAIAELNDGNDEYSGGEGVDTYDTTATSQSVTIDLVAGTANSSETGSDTLVGFENVNSGAGDDAITGSSEANVVNAGGGADMVGLGDGDDTAVAQSGDGNDSYDGGAGSDTYDTAATGAAVTIDLAAGTASSAAIGTDTIASFENVATGAGDDSIVCDDADNVVNSGSGNDNVDLRGGDDTVIAVTGDGDDRYNGGEGNDTYDFSTTTADALIDLISQSVTSVDLGRDIIVSFENVNGGHGSDTIVANDARNIFIGGEGNDRFEFHSSAAIGYGHGNRDQILDFSVGDRIDIEKVRDEFADDLSGTFDDKNIETFVILRDQNTAFSRPGELKIKYDNIDGHDVTILQGNTDYDSAAEFELELAGTYVLTDDDFYRA